MSNINNFSLVGIGSNVRFGKGNGFVKYTAGSGFYVQGSDNATLTNLSIAEPTAGTHATTKNYVDTITGGTALSAGLGINFTAGTISTVVDGTTILNSTGTLKVGQIVDANVATGAAIAYSKLALTGHIVNADIASGAAIAVNKLAALGSNAAVITDASGFLTTGTTTSAQIGYLGDVTSNIQAQLGTKLNLSGGTVTGEIFYNGTPTTGSSLVNKAYVEGVAAGLDAKQAVRAATTTNLAASYSGTPNFTLTGSANGALVVDGVTMAVNDRVLVKNQTDEKQNGIYSVTQTGDAGSPFIITRTVDMNVTNEIPSAYTFVIEGSTMSGHGYVVTGFTNSNVLDTNNIVWTQFSQAGAYSVSGNGGLAINNSGVPATFSVDFSNMLAGAALSSSDEFAISQDGTNVVTTTLGTLATYIAGASVSGTGAIHATAGTVSISTTNEFTQTGGSLGLVYASGSPVFDNTGIDVHVDGATVVKTGGTLAVGTVQTANIAANAVATAKIADANVTYAKLQNETASTLLGNPGTASAAPSEITLGTNLVFTGTTLAHGTSGVTAGTYGDNLHPAIVTVDANGHVTSASTGSITLGTGSVTSVATGTGLTGGPITNTGTVSVAAHGISAALFRQSVANTLVGNPTGSTADVVDITLGATLAFVSGALQTLALSGDVSTPANSFVTTIGSNKVGYSKIQKVGGLSLLGNPTGSAADVSEITLDGGLAFSTTTLTTVVNNSLTNTGGSLAVQLVSTGGIAVTAGGLLLDLTTLTHGTSATTDKVAIDNGGTTKYVTVSELVTSVVVAQASAIQANVGAGGTAQTIGTLPTYGSFKTAVARVIVNVGTVFTGATTLSLTTTAGTLMTISENDIGTTGIYIAELPLAIDDKGHAVTANFDVAPTGGTAQVTVKFDLI